MLDELRQPLTEGAGVLLAQVDLIVRAAEAESHGFRRWAAIQVVFQRDAYFLDHLSLHDSETSRTKHIEFDASRTATPPSSQSLQPQIRLLDGLFRSKRSLIAADGIFMAPVVLMGVTVLPVAELPPDLACCACQPPRDIRC